MLSRAGQGCVLFGCLAFVAGCGSGAPEGAESDDELATASFALNTLPAGAQCLQITGTGTATFSLNVTLTSANVSLGRLPLGASTINANVYDVACNLIATQSPTWIADPQTVTFRVGVITTLQLNLRQNNAVGTSLNFVPNLVGVASGYTGSAAVAADGSLRISGWMMGLASNTVFGPQSALNGVLELAADRNQHACARTASNVYCWGSNSSGQLGSGVSGTWTYTPTAVPGIGAGAQQVGVGESHSCAMSSAGNPYCWGNNAYGQLGNGTTTSSSTPLFVSTNSGTSGLAVGSYHNCINTYVGVNCWGLNSSGQIGDGTTTNRLSYTAVSGTSGVTSLSAGGAHTCAVRADGTVRCWGANGAGQLGDGTTTQRLSPVQVSGITDAVQVAAGASHTCIRRQNGTVACFGDNSFGAVGDGTGVNRSVPTTVPGVSGAVAISAGWATTCVLQDNQQVLCWGFNASNNCGDGTVTNRFKPVTATVQ